MSAVSQKISEAPLRNSKPVVRLGRKATDQTNNLKAGLPKRGVVDLQGVGSQLGSKPYAQGLVFFWKVYRRLVSPLQFALL